MPGSLTISTDDAVRSSFRRSWWMSPRTNSNREAAGPHTPVKSKRFGVKWPTLRTSIAKTANSLGVIWTTSPSTRASCTATSRLRRPTRRTSGSVTCASARRCLAATRTRAQNRRGRSSRTSHLCVSRRRWRAVACFPAPLSTRVPHASRRTFGSTDSAEWLAVQIGLGPSPPRPTRISAQRTGRPNRPSEARRVWTDACGSKHARLRCGDNASPSRRY